MTKYLKGIDVSIWQNEVNWQRVAQSEYNQFAYIKACQNSNVDKWFVYNWKTAKGLVPRGAYCYFEPDKPVKDQIDFFCDLLQQDVGELRPSLDVEDNGGESGNALAEKVHFALQHIEQRLKIKPIIYTSARWWNENVKLALSWSKEYALWIAQYNLKIQVPSKLPFGWEDWAIWQHWNEGQLSGVTERKSNGTFVRSVDLNYMKEEFADQVFIKGMQTLEQRVEKIERILKDKGLWL